MKEYPEIGRFIRDELSYEFDIPKEVSIACLIKGDYNLGQIKLELQSMLADQQFPWVEFAAENKLMWDVIKYTSQDVLYELKYVLWETVFPEYTTALGEWASIRLGIEQLACNKKGWLEASWLFNQASLKIEHPTYYNINCLELSTNSGILEAKKNNRKDATGYLRYSFLYRCRER